MQYNDRRSNFNCELQNINLEQPLLEVKALLVEDELDIADLLLFLFRDAGAEVTWVKQAHDALQHLSLECPNILISNVRLPDQNGEWLIRQVRSIEAFTSDHLPAIAITSYTREVSAEKMLDAGFDAFIPKTAELGQIIATILELLQ